MPKRRQFAVGDGIFLQSFVLRHFSIVQESEAREPHLTTNLSSGLNPFRRSESDAEAEFPCPLTGLKRSEEVTVLISASDPGRVKTQKIERRRE